MKTKRPKKRRGGAASPVVVARWNAKGYLTPAQAARAAGVARTTVYGWVARGALVSPTAFPAVVKGGESALVWVLAAAIEAMKPRSPDEAIAEAARGAP
jgi:predicted DNA-binding transcriptional regulator AlpA